MPLRGTIVNRSKGGYAVSDQNASQTDQGYKQDEDYDPDFPIRHVPQEERRSLQSIAVVLLGFTFFSGTMIAGASLGASYPFADLLWVLLVGNLLLGIYVAVLSVIAARTGLTTVLLARYTLGDGGSKLASLLLGGTQVGWFGVTVAFMALPFADALGLPDAALPALMVLWGVLHGATAYFGYRGMEKLSLVSVPLLLVVGLVSVAIAIRDAGGMGEIIAMEPTETMTFATALTVIVGTFASGGTQAPNWARFAKTAKVAFIAAFLAFFAANALMVLFGAFGGLVYDEPDLAEVLAIQGLALFSVLFLTLNLWTTNDNAAYAFGVAGAEVFNVNRKRVFVVGGSAIGVVLAITGIYDMIMPWLEALGTYIPPLGGVIIGDFFFVWQGKLPRLEHITFARIRWSAVLGYALGVLAALLVPGIPPLNGIIGAIVGMLVFRPLVAKLKGAEHTVHENAEYVG